MLGATAPAKKEPAPPTTAPVIAPTGPKNIPTPAPARAPPIEVAPDLMAPLVREVSADCMKRC